MKTVCPQGRMGSNPILSVGDASPRGIGSKGVRPPKTVVTAAIETDEDQADGEVPKLAEGTPLERVQVVNSGARVQIPPSPLRECRFPREHLDK